MELTHSDDNCPTIISGVQQSNATILGWEVL